MVAPFADAYKNMFEKGELGAPQSMRPEDRTAEYFLRWSQYVYGAYSAAGYTHIRLGGQFFSGRSVAQMREYARGMQSIEKYKKQLDFRNDAGDRKEMDAISWENTALFGKLRNLALNTVRSTRYKPGVRAIDPSANDMRINQYFRDRLAAMPGMKQAMSASGVSPDGVSPISAQSDPDDIKVLLDLGGYQVADEIVMTDAIQTSLNLSDEQSFFDKFVEDLFDIGFASGLIYRRPGGSKYYIKYVDPIGIIVPRSTYNDFRDSQYRAIVERTTLANLRIEADLDEETMGVIAKTYEKKLGNGAFIDGSTAYGFRARSADFSALRSNRYDEFAVDVMTLYFVALDAEQYVTGVRKDGLPVFDRVGSDSRLSSSDKKNGKEMSVRPVQYLYRCKWVVGTNIVFDYGKDEVIVREGEPGAKQVLFPLVVYALSEPSYVERCIPTIDDIEIAVRKKRMALARIPPGAEYLIDLSKLEETVQIGNESFTVKDLMGVYFNTGLLYHRSVGDYADSGMTSQSPAIQVMKSSRGELINAFVLELNANIQILHELLGTNAVATGTVKSQDLLNGVANQMQQTADAGLYPLHNAYRDAYIYIEKVLGLKYQTAVLWGDIDFSKIAGTGAFPANFQLKKESLIDREFYFTVEVMPSASEKQDMMQILISLSKERRISEADFFSVYQMILDGDIKKAQYFMSLAAKRAERSAQEIALQNTEAQAKANQETAAVAEQMRAATELKILEGKIRLSEVESQLRINEEQVKSRLRISEEIAKDSMQQGDGTKQNV